MADENQTNQVDASTTDSEGKGSRRRRLRSVIVVGAGLGICMLLAGGIWTIWGPAPENHDEIQEVLREYDAENYEVAHVLALKLANKPGAGHDELGLATFVVGSSLIHEAEGEWDANRKRAIYMIAARYFQESAAKGMPDGYVAEGFYGLGLSLFKSGLKTQALPALLRSLELTNDPIERQNIYWMLADVYLSDPELDRNIGLEYSNAYLSSPSLSDDDYTRGELQRCDLLVALERDEEAEAELDSILESLSPESLFQLEAHLRLGKLWMAREKEWRYQAELLQNTELRRQADEALRNAIRNLKIASRSEDRGGVSRYLLAVADQRLGNYTSAADRFGQVRREFVDSALSIPAALGEAEVLQRTGELAIALKRYLQLIEFANTLNYKESDVEWLTAEQFDDRLMEAQVGFRRAGRYDLALEMSKRMWPPVARDLAMQLQAETYSQWGDALAGDPFSVPSVTSSGQTEPVDLQESRRLLREAALAYYKLTKLRRSSPRYLDYVWESAEHYYRGRDYAKAIELYRHYLDAQPEEREARAYMRIGESKLAMGRTDDALDALEQCITFFPDDSDAFRARLIASKILVAKNNQAEAKKLLLYNIDVSSLEPESNIWRDSLFALGQTLYNEAVALEVESRKLGVDSNQPAEIEAGLKKLEEARTAFKETSVRLTEAVTRYHDVPEAIEAQYLLAESIRQAAKYPQKRLKTITINQLRFNIELEVNKELGVAFEQYDNLEEALSRAQDERALTEVEGRILRNCAFAKADVLFDQKKFPEAIAAYETVSNRYANRPEALEAFCRVATCYRILNRPDMARDKIAQAKLFLQDRIPKDAKFNATTRYTRDEWVNYLDWLATL